MRRGLALEAELTRLVLIPLVQGCDAESEHIRISAKNYGLNPFGAGL